MKYILDENIAAPLAQMLSIFERGGNAGHELNDSLGIPRNTVEHITTHFVAGTKDPIWIPAIGNWPEKPVVVMGDARILTKPVLKALAKDAGLTFVVMAEGYVNLPWQEQAWKMLKVWPDIVKKTRKLGVASIFDVKIRNGDVELRSQTSQL